MGKLPSAFDWDADETLHQDGVLELGKLAVEHGLISADELDDCRREQEELRHRGQAVQLVQIFLRRRLVDLSALVRLATHGTRGMPAIPVLSRFEVVAELGHGGMGVVYRAHDRELNRPVALKILKGGDGTDPILRERFGREAKVIARLSHPYVVGLHDVGQEEGWTYIVMELVEGESLDKILARGVEDVRWIVDLLEKVARAVHHAHKTGVIHRDLKPANILVSNEGIPKVVDFGLAHEIESGADLTRTGIVVGTPLYMAPEQAKGLAKLITARTDVYALGAILYEALTGKPPHTGGSAVDILTRIIGDDAVPPRRLDSKVPRELEAIAMKAIEKEPDRRYWAMSDFADDLARYLDHKPVKAKRVTLLRRSSLWIRRNRVPAILGTAGVLGVLLTVATFLWFVPTARESARRARLEDVERRAGQAVAEEIARLERADPETVLSEGRPDAFASQIRSRVEPSDAGEVEAVEKALGAYRSGPLFSRAHYEKANWSMAFRYDPEGEFGIRAQIEIARKFAHGRRYEEAARFLNRVRTRYRRQDAVELLAQVLLEKGDLSGAASAFAEAGIVSPMTRLLDAVMEEKQSLPIPGGGAGGQGGPTYESMPILALERPTLVLPWREGRPAFEIQGGVLVPVESPLAALAPSDVAVDAACGDADGDGLPEIFVAIHRPGKGGGFVVLSAPGGAWQIVHEDLTNSTQPIALAAGDLNGDGTAEAVVLFKWESNEHWIVVGPDYRRLSFRPPGTRVWAFTPRIADLDGDGRAELLIGRSIQIGGEFEVYGLREDGPALLASTPVGEPIATAILPDGRLAVAAEIDPGYLVGELEQALGKDAQDAIVLLSYNGRELETVARQDLGYRARESSTFGNLAAGQLAGEPAFALSTHRSLVEPGRQRAEGFRLRVVLGDPTNPPLALGFPYALSTFALLDLDADGESELVFPAGDKLIVRGKRTRPLPPLAGVDFEESPAGEAATLLHAVDDLFEFEEFEAARHALAEVIERFPGTSEAAEAERMRVEALLHVAKHDLTESDKHVVARELDLFERRYTDAMEKFQQAAREAREAADRLIATHPGMRRRLFLLAAEASRQALDWEAFARSLSDAAGTEPGSDDPPLGAVQQLEDLEERVVLSGDPASAELPFVADFPARLAHSGEELVGQLDSHSERHLAGVPVNYPGGAISIEADFALEGSIWSGGAQVGLVPLDPSDDLRRLHGAWRFFCHGTTAWDLQGVRVGELGSEFRLDRYRGRWRVLYSYVPEARLAAIEIRDLDLGGGTIFRGRVPVESVLPAGPYVFGFQMGFDGGDALVSHAYHPAVTAFRIGPVTLRASHPGTHVARSAPLSARELRLAGGGALFRGDRASALDFYRKALERDATDLVARAHLALCGGAADEFARGFEIDPYRFVTTIDDALRGARPEEILAMGRMLQEAVEEHPGPCLALMGYLDQAPLHLTGDSPAERYLRRRDRLGPPEKQNEDWEWFFVRSMRTAGNELPTVIWAPGPDETSETVRQAAVEATQRLQQEGDYPALMRAWVAVSRLLLLEPDNREALLLRSQLARASGMAGPAERDLYHRAEVVPDDFGCWEDLALHFAWIRATRETLDHLAHALRLGMPATELDREEFAFLAENPRFQELRIR